MTNIETPIVVYADDYHEFSANALFLTKISGNNFFVLEFTPNNQRCYGAILYLEEEVKQAKKMVKKLKTKE